MSREVGTGDGAGIGMDRYEQERERIEQDRSRIGQNVLSGQEGLGCWDSTTHAPWLSLKYCQSDNGGEFP